MRGTSGNGAGSGRSLDWRNLFAQVPPWVLTILFAGLGWAIETYWRPDEDNGAVFIGAILGFAVGLGGTKQEIIARLDAQDQSSEVRFNTLRDINRIFDQVQRCAVETNQIVALMEEASGFSVESLESDRLVIGLVDDSIEGLTKLLRDAKDKEISQTGPKTDWYNSLIGHAEHSIDAISTHDIDGNFWDDPTGQDYLQKQHERILTNDVTVRRIFVLPEEMNDGRGWVRKDSQVHRAMEIQHEMRIKVAFMFERPNYHPSDMVIFDRQVSMESVEGHGRVQNTVLRFERNDVTKHLALFEDLWANATRFEPSSEDDEGWLT